MMNPKDRAYYERRLDQERLRAGHAANEHLARIHAELARRYARLLDGEPADDTHDDA